jgi:hypothetical protein
MAKSNSVSGDEIAGLDSVSHKISRYLREALEQIQGSVSLAPSMSFTMRFSGAAFAALVDTLAVHTLTVYL